MIHSLRRNCIPRLPTFESPLAGHSLDKNRKGDFCYRRLPPRCQDAYATLRSTVSLSTLAISPTFRSSYCPPCASGRVELPRFPIVNSHCFSLLLLSRRSPVVKSVEICCLDL